MRRIYLLFFIMITAPMYGVMTQYINDFDFKKLSAFQLSNVSLVEGGGLTLSRNNSTLYSSESILWSMAWHQGKILVGTGDKAALLEINGTSQKEVFSSENDIILSDIESDGAALYVSTLPQSRILKLAKDYSIEKEWSVSNKYVWDIVITPDQTYILCGNPAAVYSISGGFLTSVAEVPQEQNLLMGLYHGKTLYFAGESMLYKYAGSKAIALAAFDNPISGMIIHNGDIYLITATHDPSVSAGPNGNGKNNNSSSSSSSAKNTSYFGDSALYRISKDGHSELLYKKKNIQFTSLARLGDDLIIGTGKDGGYLSYGLDDRVVTFSSLGTGKFMAMVEYDRQVYGVMLYPSRIIRLESDYYKEGLFLSDVIDTENLSSWGEAFLSRSLMPGTDIEAYSRTGLVKDQALWEDWKSFNKSLQSSPGRYIQYKLTLSSQGKNTPLVKGLTIPFMQKNIAPRIEKIDIKYEKKGVNIDWSAEDINKDKLNYDIFLAPHEQEWVKLNKYPLNEDAYILDYKSFPQGKYRVKVIARDDWSNPQEMSLSDYQVSELFIIDNEAPSIEDVRTSKVSTGSVLEFTAIDSMISLTWVGYSVNGGMWKGLSPQDGIMDEKRENFKVKIPEGGPLFIQVLVRDGMGNESVQGVYLP